MSTMKGSRRTTETPETTSENILEIPPEMSLPISYCHVYSYYSNMKRLVQKVNTFHIDP